MLREALADLESQLSALPSSTCTVSTASTPGDASSEAPSTATAAAEASTTDPDAAKTDATVARDNYRLELARAILKRRKESSKAWNAATDARAVALLRSIL